MKIVELMPKTIMIKDLNKKTPLASDTEQVISEPTIFTLNGEVLMVYGRFPSPVEDVRQACKQIKYDKTTRTSGLKTESRIFGFRPRIVIRGDFCSSTMLAKTFPEQHQIITELGKKFCEIYEHYAPEVYRNHRDRVAQEVLPEWMIPGTLFTSGIINKSNPLKYHFDAGNFKDCMSCMLVLRRDIEGGMLSIPEFNLKLDLQDSTYLLFDGQKILHGVTPIKALNKFSYRYSIVFYSLQQMCNCLPFNEEILRIRKLKKQREEKRILKVRTDL